MNQNPERSQRSKSKIPGKIKFLKSPTGHPFYMAYNAGDEVETLGFKSNKIKVGGKLVNLTALLIERGFATAIS